MCRLSVTNFRKLYVYMLTTGLSKLHVFCASHFTETVQRCKFNRKIPPVVIARFRSRQLPLPGTFLTENVSTVEHREKTPNFRNYKH